jgi:membrane-associated phospholipid phosphatase
MRRAYPLRMVGHQIRNEERRTRTTNMSKILITLALMCGSLQAQVAVPSLEADAGQSASSMAGSANPVIEWNRTLLMIVRTPGAQPPTIHSTRSFAILHAAMYDAVNNIDGSFSPYLVRLSNISRQASGPAAAEQAAHDVLVALYPAFQSTLDAELQQDLAQIAEGQDKTDGITTGEAVAAQILAFRKDDGANAAQPPFRPGNDPGEYQLTPPNFAPADFTQWPAVTPFAIARADEFRPSPPPELTSDEYARVLNEVKSLGIVDSATRTPEQTLIGKFWNGNIQDFWNEIAQTAAAGHQLNLAQTARLFALLNISLADTTIAFFEAKYTYRFWRPVTAIRSASNDGDPGTKPNVNWLPLSIKTAPDPSYPGAHSAISFAAAEVLKAYFGDRFAFDVTSEASQGVTRHFNGFSAAAQEAGLSRIYAGQHFRTDHIAGRRLGQHVAESVVDTTLLPRSDSNSGGLAHFNDLGLGR